MEKIDNQTLAAYDARAAIFAQDWHDQPPPVDLHALIRRFFKPGGSTVDIGCGSGREVAWLVANGYPALGYDPSNGLLREARARYPEILFAAAALPELTGIPEANFDNVLCETVLMHLPPAAGGRALLGRGGDGGRRCGRRARPPLCRLRQGPGDRRARGRGCDPFRPGRGQRLVGQGHPPDHCAQGVAASESRDLSASNR